MEKIKVGVIGCGKISQAYFNGMGRFPILEVSGCADLIADVAKAKAEEHNCIAYSVDDLIRHPDIQIIVNLTVPQAHTEINVRALEAGKHVHCEKPLAISRDEGRKVLHLAKEKGLRVGCAPDTFLGGGHQTTRKLLDDGWIGTPLSGTAFLMSRGPECWHPNPFFFYQKGSGPMLDMGPYYVTALVHLLGPVRKVVALTGKGWDTRIATCKEHFGKEIAVDVPTYYAGLLQFHSGAIVTVNISFDVLKHGHSPIEIYGTDGSMNVPNPNGFGGPASVFRKGYNDWQTMGLSHGYLENYRGIGVADMAHAIAGNRAHRCTGDVAFHALDIMYAFEDSAREGGKPYMIDSTCERPQPLPLNMVDHLLD